MITKSEVKYIQSLAHQKSRNETQCFLAEGVRLVDDLLACCPEQIKVVFCKQEYVNRLLTFNTNISYKIITEEELCRISQMQQPNQVLAVIEQFHNKLPEKKQKEWILALDGIQDPGNMGTIIRLADWFGIKHIVCSKDCVDAYNPKVVQSSMGSIARVACHYVSLNEFLLQYDLPLIGATMTGEALQTFHFPKAGILIIGNEGKGIRQEITSVLTQSLTIPSFGGAESLNAAMATGIILWELRSRQ
jgi:TrmH family RNA methyltransferase